MCKYLMSYMALSPKSTHSWDGVVGLCFFRCIERPIIDCSVARHCALARRAKQIIKAHIIVCQQLGTTMLRVVGILIVPSSLRTKPYQPVPSYYSVSGAKQWRHYFSGCTVSHCLGHCGNSHDESTTKQALPICVSV